MHVFNFVGTKMGTSFLENMFNYTLYYRLLFFIQKLNNIILFLFQEMKNKTSKLRCQSLISEQLQAEDNPKKKIKRKQARPTLRKCLPRLVLKVSLLHILSFSSGWFTKN